MTKLAIQKAIEGGWRPKGSRIRNPKNVELELDDIEDIVDPTFYADAQGFRQSVASLFLDPSFWQALGKSLGWGVSLENSRVCSGCKSIPYYEANCIKVNKCNMTHIKGYNWKYQWHRFITHLSEGKDADSFFKDLLPS